MRKKKEKVFQNGIEITKPWSREMYDHNDKVLAEAKGNVKCLWLDAYATFPNDGDYEDASEELIEIQNAVTVIGYGCGYTFLDVYQDVMEELETMPYYRMKEVVEDLDIELEEGFVGFK